jgi:ribosomal protein S3
MGELLTVTVSPMDAGFVIGRSGETIQNIRGILRVFGYKAHRRVSIHLTNQEPNNQRSKPNDHAPQTHHLPDV